MLPIFSIPIARAFPTNQATARLFRKEKSRQEAKNMAASRGGVFACGSTTRRAGSLPPLPGIGETADASCVLSGSSPTRSQASLETACYGDDAKKKPAAKNMLLASSDTVGRGRRYGSFPRGSYGNVSPTHHRPASPSLSIRRGHDYRESHGGKDTSSSVTAGPEKEQVRLPTRADFMKPSTTLPNIRVQTTRHPPLTDMRGDVSDSRPPKASGKEIEGYDQNNGQSDNVSSHITSGRNRSEMFIKPFAIRQKFRLQTPSGPSPLDMRAEGSNHVPPRSTHNRSTHQSHAQSWSHQHLGGIDVIDEYPRPPPFYKCEACDKRTAFYRLKCCDLVVCQGCGCSCDPAEAAEDEKLESRRQRGKVVQAGKEKLPEVKLEGSDLFLWQEYKFHITKGLMLCMAKRTGNHLQYYFAPVDELMDPQVKKIKATVYDFRQYGREARSLSVRNLLLLRKQLR